MKLRYIIQFFLVSIAIFFAAFWWFENRYIQSINIAFLQLQNSTIPSLTSLIELSSSTRRASIKAIEYSMRGQEKDRFKTMEALNNISSHLESILDADSTTDGRVSSADLIAEVNSFRSLVEEYLIMSTGPSVDELFDEQEKVQAARRTLIHAFKPINTKLKNQEKLLASKIQSEARKTSVKLIEFSLRGNQSDKQKAVTSIDSFIEAIQEFQDTVDSRYLEIDEVLKAAESYLNVVENFIQTSTLRKHPIDRIYDQEAKIHQARKALIQSLYPMIDYQYENLNKTALDGSNAISNADWIQKISSFAFIILAVILGYILSRMIVRPIYELSVAAQKIGKGQLDTHVKAHSKNEIGQLALSFNDMTRSLRQSNQRIEQMAYYDELTGLANRRLLLNRLEQIVTVLKRHHHRGVLMMLDLDRFKNINDSLGHAAGDTLLVDVAQRIESITRHEDTVCRLGGDEFVILIPLDEVKEDEVLSKAANVAEKIRKSLEKPYQLESSFYNATPSIGIVLLPHLDDTPETLLRRADAAMYRSKKEGGNRVSFYEKAIQQAVDERLLLEKDLQQALQDESLFLVYQPQCTASGRVVGVEVLIRWHHPEKGYIPPPKFIQIAEETGMITRLGNWIIKRGLEDISKLLQTQNIDVIESVSINVSAHQFTDQSFSNNLINELREHEIAEGLLKIELTETALLKNIEATRTHLNQLSQKGVRCSLDDFGTGYSSLSYLSKLPLDEVKIDRSFLQDAENNPKVWSIIESIIDIAEALDLKVVAEGVEQQSEVDQLKSINCDVFQGFFFYKPMNFDKLQELLVSQSK